eukprot:CAMPEP_0115157210 /NCGR_PEP_ID=MMETSP0227-20121206/68927_1 /TAXON_ID=89957 /ORGANISM="Polarella glacialis, Strain CCMP 1383" /LENGTH=297 /DNA_ID=CAMNT_0002568579 /DNA_START=29 /DNA_END=920 /DNA_ORIENTATION=+
MATNFFGQLLLLACLGCTVVSAQLEAALEADGECNDGECALNALQLRASSQKDVADSGDAVYDGVPIPEGLLEQYPYPSQSQASDSRRRGSSSYSPVPAVAASSQCCLCKSGVISWSASGQCTHCNNQIAKRTTPKADASQGTHSFPAAPPAQSSATSISPRKAAAEQVAILHPTTAAALVAILRKATAAPADILHKATEAAAPVDILHPATAEQAAILNKATVAAEQVDILLLLVATAILRPVAFPLAARRLTAPAPISVAHHPVGRLTASAALASASQATAPTARYALLRDDDMW